MEKQRTSRSTTRQRSVGATGSTGSEMGTSSEELGGFGDTAMSGSTSAGIRADGSTGVLGASQPRSSGVVDRVKNSATAQLNTQKGRAAAGLDTVAQAVRQTTQQLRSEQHETMAQYIEQAADQLERFSSRMRDTDVNDILRNVQQLARRQPALFIGGSFAVGVLAARFLRSSQENDDYDTRDDAGRDYATQRHVSLDTDDLSTGAY